jgi:hypothetical protein
MDLSSETSSSHEVGEAPDRRRWPRDDSSSAPSIGRARLLPHLSNHYPSLRPNGWYRVVAQNPDALDPRARDGYIWVEVDARPRQVWARHFEVSLDPRVTARRST